MVTVDTSAWIDFFNGKSTAQTEHLSSILGTTIIVVGDLVLAEILQGFRNDKDFLPFEKHLKLKSALPL